MPRRFDFVDPYVGPSVLQHAAAGFGDILDDRRRRDREAEEKRRFEETLKINQERLKLEQDRNQRDAAESERQAATQGFVRPDALLGDAPAPRTQITETTRHLPMRTAPSSPSEGPGAQTGFMATIDGARATASGAPAATRSGAAPTHGFVRVGEHVYLPGRSARSFEADQDEERARGRLTFADDIEARRLTATQQAQEAALIAAGVAPAAARARVLTGRDYPDELDPAVIKARRGEKTFENELDLARIRERERVGGGAGGGGSDRLLGDVGRAIDDIRPELSSAERRLQNFDRPQLVGEVDMREPSVVRQHTADSTAAANRVNTLRNRLDFYTQKQDSILAPRLGARPGQVRGTLLPNSPRRPPGARAYTRPGERPPTHEEVRPTRPTINTEPYRGVIGGGGPPRGSAEDRAARAKALPPLMEWEVERARTDPEYRRWLQSQGHRIP